MISNQPYGSQGRGNLAREKFMFPINSMIPKGGLEGNYFINYFLLTLHTPINPKNWPLNEKTPFQLYLAMCFGAVKTTDVPQPPPEHCRDHIGQAAKSEGVAANCEPADLSTTCKWRKELFTDKIR